MQPKWKLCILCLLVGLLVVISAAPSAQDNTNNGDYANVEGVNNGLPTITTMPRTVTQKEGSRIQLDCEGQQHEDYAIVWRQGVRILALGGIMITRNIRITVFKNGTLFIQQASKADSGVYTCSVSTATDSPNVSVSHEVIIVSPDEATESMVSKSVTSGSVIAAASLFAFLVLAAIKFWRK